MTRFLSAGFIDSFRLLYPEKQEYTWWSYRFNSRAKNKGWRIDYCMTGTSDAEKCQHTERCRTFRSLSNGFGNRIKTENSMEDRIQKAVELFKSGYNCSQSVVAAFADMYGFTQEQAVRMSASFGGGIGRMRETCGAACGLFLIAGLETGATEATDREGKAANYAVVQELAAEFKKRNGSLICGELLGLKKKEPISTVPEERNTQYYSKRPCAKMVEEAARIWVEYLEKHPK